MILGLLCALLVSVVQAYLSYRERMVELDQQLLAVQQLAAPALSRSLWAFDSDQVMVQLKGITKHPDVNAVRLDAVGQAPIQLGRSGIGTAHEVKVVLEYSDSGKQQAVGTLTLLKDLGAIQSELVWTGAKTLIGNTLVILSVILFVLSLYNTAVRRRLEDLVQELADTTPDALRRYPPPRPTNVPAKDEIDALVAAIVRLKEAGGRALVEVDQHNRELEQVLTQLSESKSLLQTVIDTAPVRIFWKNRDC